MPKFDGENESPAKPQSDGDTVIHADERTLIHEAPGPDVDPQQSEGAAAEEILGPALQMTSGGRAGDIVALPTAEGATWVMGRSEEADLALDDGSVSRRHVELRRQGNYYYVSDLGSANGTLVNEQMISRDHLLRPGEVLKVGIYEFVLVDPVFQEAALPSQLPVPATPAPAVAAPPEMFPTPPEPHAKPWLTILLVVAGVILIYGIRKISKQETFQIGTVWEDLFSGPKGPNLAYPLMEVRTSPMPGEVFFQNESIGFAPVEKKLLDGITPNTEFELRAEFRLEALDERITVKRPVVFALDQEVAQFLLEAPIGQIYVKKIPPNCQVLLEYQVADSNEIKIRQPPIDFKEPLLAPYGRYKIELRRNEQFVYRRKIEITEATPSHAFEIEEEDLTYAPFSLVSDPPEAEIYLDGELLAQKTPLTDFRMPFGSHSVVLRKENHLDFTLEELPNPVQVNEPLFYTVKLPITVAGERIVRAKREYNQGLYKQSAQSLYDALRVQPPPTGYETAEIQYWLGQNDLMLKDYKQSLIHYRKARRFIDTDGKAPFDDDGKLGEARVYLQQDNKQEAIRLSVEVFFGSEDVTVRSGAEEVFHKASPLQAVVYIDTVPPGAQIYLNGTRVQSVTKSGAKVDAKTPMIIPGLPVGGFNILLTKPGFEDYKEVLRVTLSDLKAIKVKLVPKN